jgi:hypothetical protein
MFGTVTKIIIPLARGALVGCILASCAATESVAPFDRGYLSEDGMQWEADARNAKLKGHVYTSKEASSGGVFPAGGGCGCN